MMRRLMFSMLVVAAGVVVVNALPDLARYLKIREM